MPDPGGGWDPAQYHRFRREREAPFGDLLALVRPVPGGRVADLGCGTGELTARLHHHVRARETVGIDRSAEMLADAGRLAVPGLRFEAGDIATFGGSWDVVASNAALHWVPDHEAVLARWAGTLRPGGQLAVQVPANVDHPAHRIAAAVAEEFTEAFGGPPPADPVLSVLAPGRYAELLDELGFADQHVRLQVYGHRLASTADVVEWLKGSSLTRFRSRLDDATYAEFLDRYRARVVAEMGERAPYFYAFKRILMWGQAPG
ncbi:MAG TPA: methyltransferase domain-containing protein [Acidimicrobiales bacterium]|nr:methyltransferase domain-containing protein [Acidimicrobiales bacterium]